MNFKKISFFHLQNINRSESLIRNNFLWMLTRNSCFVPTVINIGKLSSYWYCMILVTKPPCLYIIWGLISFNVFMLVPMHWVWNIYLWLSSDSVILCYYGSVFDIIDKIVSLNGYTETALVMDNLSPMQLSVNLNCSTLSMTSTDNSVLKNFHDVLSMHRLEICL